MQHNFQEDTAIIEENALHCWRSSKDVKSNGKFVLPFPLSGYFSFSISPNGILKQPFRNLLLPGLVLSRFDNFVGLQISQLNFPDRFQFKTNSVMEFVGGDKLRSTENRRK